VPTPIPAPLSGVSDSKLQDVERELERSRQQQKELSEQARALAAEVDGLRKQLISAASEAQDTEDSLSSLETQLRDLREREQELKAELGTRDDQLREVLMALERLAMRPPEAVLVQPMPAEDSVRSAILLRAVVPELAERAAALRAELEQLTVVRREISLRRTDIALAVAKLDRQHSTLATLFERKQALQRSTEAKSAEAAKRADSLAENADSMRELLAKLEAERKRREEEERLAREAEERRLAEEARRMAALAMAKPEVPRLPPSRSEAPAPGAPSASAPSRAAPGGVAPGGVVSAGPDMTPEPSAATMVVHGPTLALRPMNKMRGLMPLPARGKVIARYGQKDAAGSAQKGIVLQTRARAQVIAPADGVVAFAGSFRGYGQLLIMEHGGGYHTLLSGLDQIDATVGQRLLMGEPVGTMGPADAPSLYFELRHDGQSINPMPWLTARKG
jgi:septal ring factor EnvC (AmiA/AmiB activator)